MDKPDRLIELDIKIRRTGLWLLYITGACLIMYLFRQLRPVIENVLTVFSPFMVALIVAYIFNPVVIWLQRRFRLKRMYAILITYCCILLITILFFLIVLPILYAQIRDISANLKANLPLYVDRVAAWFQLQTSREEVQEFINVVQSRFNIGGGEAVNGKQVVQQTFTGGKMISDAFFSSIGFVIGFFIFITFVVVITFYFLLDYNRMSHVARVLLPEKEESKVFALWKRIDAALGGFLRGQLIVAATIAVLYTVALFMMGMGPTAILVGLMAGLGNMVPYLGPVIGGVPAALWVIFGQEYDTGQEKMIGLGIIVLFSAAVQSLDGFFLQPRIVGKSAELHPLYVLLALLIGAQFGIGGMILAVPLAIAARVILKDMYWDLLEARENEDKRMAAMAKNAGDDTELN